MRRKLFCHDLQTCMIRSDIYFEQPEGEGRTYIYRPFSSLDLYHDHFLIRVPLRRTISYTPDIRCKPTKSITRTGNTWLPGILIT